MRLTVCSTILVVLTAGTLISNDRSSGFDGPPMIERFEAVPDCIYPDPRRGILSYRVTNVVRLRIDAIHRSGRVRAFHTAGGRTLWPSLSATNVLDPLAADDVEAYVLTATGERGLESVKRLAFRYRRAAFELIPPTSHTRDTTGGEHFTRYESRARVLNVDSITCSFRFDKPIGGESGRAGSADIFSPDRDPIARCHISWRSVSKARASGTVEWIARVIDPCTQGRITRTAHVNPIP